MLPKRFLHYEVLEKVSSSGMSEIYKVRNLKLAGRVEALKLLSEKHRKNSEIYKRFRQEAEILSTFNHRCIPVIYEINEFRNRPFITMEFVNGKSLLDITEYRILPIGKILAVAMEVVSALKASHSRGIIHRDLKLSNIMITRQGGVKIIDFGVASMGWNTPEEDRGLIIGTLPYMSPEQARGEQLDHRSDIFSLGICIYELLSGRLPFFDPDADEVLRRVQEEQPRTLKEHRPETPEPLEQCVFRCIEKDPRKRYQNLDELARVLEEVERHLKERGESLAAADGVRERMESLSVDLVAREEEYGRIAKAYFRAISGKGIAVFIEGEAGVGKTRLVEELVKHCDATQVYFASGQAHPGMNIPYRPVAEAIRYLLLAHDVVTDREMEDFIDDRYGSASVPGMILKSFLLQTPSENLEIAGRENLFDTVADLLAKFARQAPLVMILENLHWADRATLDLLAHLTGSIQGRRILLLITYRHDEPGQDPGVPLNLFAQIAEEKGKTGDALLMRLNRLNRRETEHLVNFTLPGNQFKKSFHQLIYDRSDGNPLYILELLKLFARLGMVTRSGNVWTQAKGEKDFPVPTRIHDLISRRLSCLGEKEMVVLEAAAVEGISFTSESVCALTRMDRLTVLNILRSLWRQRIIELKGESYRFDPPLVREVLNRQVLPELKREYHLRLARLYIESPPPGKAGPGNVARHFHLGGDAEQAIRYYMEAGYAALNLYADSEGLRYFDNALELLEETPLGPGVQAALDIHLNRSEIFIRMGRPEQARTAAEEAVSLARAIGSPEDLGRALKMIGKICHLDGEGEEARTQLEEALEYTTSPSERAEILNLFGLIAENRGDRKRAMQFFSDSLAISNSAGNRLRVAQTLNHMGRTFLNKGDRAAALLRFKKALSITEEIGDRRGMAVNTNNVGMLLRRMDRLEQSLRLLFRAARIFKEIRYLNGMGNTLRNIGTVFLAMGNRKKAEKFVLKADSIFEKIGSQQGVALCRLSLGNLHAAAGAVGPAFDHFIKTMELGRNIDYPRVVAYALTSRGALELSLGLLDRAVKSLESAEETARESGDLLLTTTILGHLGLALCLTGEGAAGHAMMLHALGAAERSRDSVALRETHFFLCRAELMAGHAARAEKNFLKGSTYIDRNARPARKAGLYLESGIMEYRRKRPLQAHRKFETAFALYRGLGYRLKMLECLNGACIALTHLSRGDRLAHYENLKSDLIQRLEEGIPSDRDRRTFRQYHSRGGPLAFLRRDA